MRVRHLDLESSIVEVSQICRTDVTDINQSFSQRFDDTSVLLYDKTLWLGGTNFEPDGFDGRIVSDL